MENKNEVVTTGVITPTDYRKSSRPDDPEVAEKVARTSEKVELIEKKVKDIARHIEKTVMDIRKMDRELASTVPDLVAQLEALIAEEEHLRAQGKTGKKFDEDGFDLGDDDEDPFKAHNDEFSMKNPLLEDDEPESDTDYRNREQRRKDKADKKNRYAKCKDLFRKIARLTHPDKTTSERKHAIFMRAKIAVENQDQEALELMYVEVTTSESDLLKRMRNRLKQVKVEYEEVITQYDKLKQSDQYLMLEDWSVEAHRAPVINHFKNIVMLNIEAARERIRKLDPERYRPTGRNFFDARDLDEDDDDNIIDAADDEDGLPAVAINRRPRL